MLNLRFVTQEFASRGQECRAWRPEADWVPGRRGRGGRARNFSTQATRQERERQKSEADTEIGDIGFKGWAQNQAQDDQSRSFLYTFGHVSSTNSHKPKNILCFLIIVFAVPASSEWCFSAICMISEACVQREFLKITKFFQRNWWFFMTAQQAKTCFSVSLKFQKTTFYTNRRHSDHDFPNFKNIILPSFWLVQTEKNVELASCHDQRTGCHCMRFFLRTGYFRGRDFI